MLALEQRGYTAGAQPKKLRSYLIDELVDDVAALLDAAHIKSAHIVGHDWGGAVAWAFAGTYPERTLSLTSIATPHPTAFKQALYTSRQWAMSWYMFFFQLPFLPETVLSAHHGKIITKHLVKSGLNKQTASEYTRRMLVGATLRSAIAWYRALRFGARATPAINVPTLFIYGGKDKYLSEKAARLTQKFVTGRYKFTYLPDATHWIPEEQPNLLANEIITFIREI